MAVAPDAPTTRPPVHSLAVLASLVKGALGPTTPTASATGVAAASPVFGDRASMARRAAPTPSSRPAKKNTTDGREPALKARARPLRQAITSTLRPVRPRAVDVTEGLGMAPPGRRSARLGVIPGREGDVAMHGAPPVKVVAHLVAQTRPGLLGPRPVCAAPGEGPAATTVAGVAPAPGAPEGDMAINVAKAVAVTATLATQAGVAAGIRRGARAVTVRLAG